MRPYRLPTTYTARRGFSLTELAIVITIIGILTGAIWVYAGQSSENVRRQQLTENILTVVNNVRAYYAGQAGMPNYGLNQITSTLISSSVIPSTMVRTTGCTSNPGGLCADSPWGSRYGGAVDPQGTFGVCNWTPPAQTGCTATPAALPVPPTMAQHFGVVIRGLSQASCTAVATANSGSAAAAGLESVTISPCDGAAAAAPLPISVATATADCVCVSGDNTAVVRFVYRLRPANF